eukprot:940198-Amphidinium_carterae.3
MSSQHSTPRSTPRSNYSGASSIARSMVRPVDFVATTIRLICQESGGEIEPENLHVTVQGCMSDSLERVEFMNNVGTDAPYEHCQKHKREAHWVWRQHQVQQY